MANRVMQDVLSGKREHGGNQETAIANICKAVEGYLPMLEELGEVMDSFWNDGDKWGFMEITDKDVNGMPIPEVHLETMKRVRDAMSKIANPMNQNMFWDYLDYSDCKESYMEWMLGGFMEYMGAGDFKNQSQAIIDNACMDENVYRFYCDMRPRAEAVWKATGNPNRDYLESWLEECATTGVLFDPVALPSVEDTFIQFCEYCEIPTSDELKAVWMAH